MKKIILAMALTGMTFSYLGCSQGSSGAGVERATPGGQAFNTIDSALGGSEGLISGSVGATSTNSVNPLAAGLLAKWEVAASYNNPKYNSSECPTTTEPTMITLKKYMGTQFEASQKRCNGSSINIFGRLDNAAGIVCIMMNKLSASTSAAMAAEPDFTFNMDAATKATLSSQCPMMATDLNNESSIPTGTAVTLSFDAPAVTTTYDLKVTIAPFGNTVFLKYGGNEINFANNEDNSNGNQRVLVSYNSSTKILRAEYISKSKGTQFPLYIHRLYKDETLQEARIVSAIHSGYGSISDTVATNRETYTVSGYPGVNSIAFAIDLFGMGGLSNGTHEACVDGSTGTITTDGPTVTSNSFSCGTTAATGRATPYATGISSINTAVSGGSTTWWNLITGSEVLSWTNRDNMLTSGL